MYMDDGMMDDNQSESADRKLDIDSRARLRNADDEHDTFTDKPFHERLDYYMHTAPVEILVIFLIVVDALLVVASLLIELELVKVIKNTSYQAHETTTAGLVHDNGTSTNTHHLELAAEGLHIASLAILAIFMVEVFLKLFAQREKFFKSKLQIADGFIVAISFAFDVALVVIKNVDSSIVNGLGLVIILRLWRLVRIINGAVMTTKHNLEERMHAHRREAMVAQEHAHDLEVKLEEKEREVQFLKTRLSKYEPVDLIPSGSTRLPAYLPETKAFPSHVLGDLADDEEYNMSSFVDGESLSRKPTGYRRGEIDISSMVDSDVTSLPPPITRSGNTFTVKKDGVPMTSL